MEAAFASLLARSGMPTVVITRIVSLLGAVLFGDVGTGGPRRLQAAPSPAGDATGVIVSFRVTAPTTDTAQQLQAHATTNNATIAAGLVSALANSTAIPPAVREAFATVVTAQMVVLPDESAAPSVAAAPDAGTSAPLAAVAGGVAGGVVVLAALAAVVTLWLKRGSWSPQAGGHSQTVKPVPSDTPVGEDGSPASAGSQPGDGFMYTSPMAPPGRARPPPQP